MSWHCLSFFPQITKSISCYIDLWIDELLLSWLCHFKEPRKTLFLLSILTRLEYIPAVSSFCLLSASPYFSTFMDDAQLEKFVPLQFVICCRQAKLFPRTKRNVWVEICVVSICNCFTLLTIRIFWIYSQVLGEKRWKEVTLVFSFPSSATNASFILRKYYISLLFHYERVYYFKAKYWTPSPGMCGILH